MAVRRWDPFRDLLSIQGEMNRLFGRTFGAEEADAAGSWVPALDVWETPDSFVVMAELTGLTSDDVEITVHENVMVLRGERKFYESVPEDSFHRIERRFGPFQRRIVLPQQCDTEKVAATMSDGLLEIRIAKAEKAKPKKVEVTARG